MLVWENAPGEGNLTNELLLNDINTYAIDDDFFNPDSVPNHRSVGIITNPPYSIKPKWVKRCYEVTKNWALLLPVESLAASGLRRMFNENGGVSVLFMDSRVDFKTPDVKWHKSAAQFPTCWVISGFGIEPNKIFDASIKEAKSKFVKQCKLDNV